MPEPQPGRLEDPAFRTRHGARLAVAFPGLVVGRGRQERVLGGDPGRPG
ncbi:hypothetical protein [[Kitasatospora] papulosa]